MVEQTHYQVLGVRPEASQSVIDAAYQRLTRQVRSESTLARRRTGNDIVVDETRLTAIEEAYLVLRDPTRRQQYDESLLARRGSIESVDLSRRAQQQLAESGAWLAEQRHEDDAVIFRIGWAADFTAVRKALEEAIPPTARRYDKTTGGWRIERAYASILNTLFDNYEPPERPPVPRMPVPIYQPQAYRPVRQQIREVWEGWPFLVMALLLLGIVVTLLFPRIDEQQLAAQATATAGALVELAQQATAEGFPTPTLEPSPLTLLNAIPQYPSVHLRTGPGTDFASLAFLTPEQPVGVIGRTADSTWVVVVTANQVGWSATWTLAIEGDTATLPIYSADSELPQVPQPTPPESAL